MRPLAAYDVPLRGAHAVVVVGCSPILGKPVAMLLLGADATVTVCHSRTTDLPEQVATADGVVAPPSVVLTTTPSPVTYALDPQQARCRPPQRPAGDKKAGR